MIIDERAEFCDATSAILAVGNAIIGDTYDTGGTNALKDLGNGKPIYLVVTVDTAFVGGTTTLEFRSDTAAALNSGSATTHFKITDALAAASLTAGYTRIIALPIEQTYKRYVGLWETVAGANVTAGKINAFLTVDPSKWTPYADAVG